MLRIEKFDGTKTYMFPNGQLATPEKIRQQYPAVDHFLHILEVNGDVVQAVMSLSAMRNIHALDDSLTDDEAIAAIETIANTPPPEVISPEERTAAALEFSNIMLLDDVEAVGDTIQQEEVVIGDATTKKLGVDTMSIPLSYSVALEETPQFLLIKRNYERGLWSAPMIAKVVKKGVLTQEQADSIIGS